MANNASPDLVPLLMTRPRRSAMTFVARLPDEMQARLDPIYSPLIDIRALETNADSLTTGAAIFTSANGVAFSPSGHGRHAFCVGSATTQAATDAGWHAEMRGETADQLVLNLTKNPPEQGLIHFSGVHTRGNICARLNANGMRVKNVPVYDQIAQSLSSEAHRILASGHTVIAPLFSPRTSAQFAIEVPRCKNVHAIVFSNAVAQNLDRASYATVTMSSAPNFCAMVTAIATVLSDLPAG